MCILAVLGDLKMNLSLHPTVLKPYTNIFPQIFCELMGIFPFVECEEKVMSGFKIS
jgi:hypothetical protein